MELDDTLKLRAQSLANGFGCAVESVESAFFWALSGDYGGLPPFGIDIRAAHHVGVSESERVGIVRQMLLNQSSAFADDVG